ncbi:T9SS type A sorting domain-containing protein [Carboxylicivirga mesophila]|uniref:T9SS type A sorting domain-containing protein n=1 Tax=Carboxylicivirga mesophila TaxID=1166478 RepID=A0ABS5KGS0_9BACT|nr:T9SS type A sorting domain-containing protein [Carboxylicivirga mesophila]MBS2213483.1 T9SS type A sorting domain-containing protein [Carboxylicivirga mesophila]
MKKNYLIILLCAISSMAIGQTVEIVKDYHDADKGYGATPTDIISNSSMLVFSGVVDQEPSSNPMFFPPKNIFEPFVTDGTASNFLPLDLYQGVDSKGYQNGSNPSKFFVLKDEIYCVAVNGSGVQKLFKINDIAGTSEEVAIDWLPQNNLHNRFVGLTGENVVWIHRDPADETDDNYYLIEWNGDVSQAPAIIPNQKGEYKLASTKPLLLNGPANEVIVIAGDKADGSLGTELIVTYNHMIMGHNIVYSDLAPGDADGNGYPDASNPENFTELNSVIYLNDSKGQIWMVSQSNGYSAELVTAVNDGLETGANNTDILGVFDGKLVVKGKAAGADTWSIFLCDPTATTNAVEELNVGFEIRNASNVVVSNGIMYFEGEYNSIPYDYANKVTPLWAYDGTTLKQITTDLNFISGIYPFNDKIYFTAEDPDAIDNGDGTFSSTYKELFVYDPAGTATSIERAIDNSITVSPNPSYGYVNVAGIDTNATYEIYSVSGSLLEQGAVINGQIDYNVQSGVYLLKISEGSNTKVVKIMVK